MGSPEGKNGRIHFGPFELDPDEQQLRKRGIPVKLQPQQFAVLWMLTQRAGQIVSRDEIHQHIWGTDTFVDFERGINFAINQIRAALGDHAEQPRYIETIPRRGYRFIAAIDSGEPGDSASATPNGQIENGEFAGAASVTPISGDRKSTTCRSEQVSASSAVGPPLPARPCSHEDSGRSSPPVILAAGLLGYRALSDRASARNNASQAGIFKHAHTQLTSHPGIYWGVRLFLRWQTIAFFWNDPNPARGDLLRAVGWR